MRTGHRFQHAVKYKKEIHAPQQLTPSPSPVSTMPNTEVTPTVFLRDIVQRPAYMNLWEKHRHRKAHWVAEMFAESVSRRFPLLCAPSADCDGL